MSTGAQPDDLQHIRVNSVLLYERKSTSLVGMKPYSQDLRERAITALESGKTQVEVAAQFSISKSTLEKWWYRWRDTGSCAALPPVQGRKRTLQGAEKIIRAEVKKRPDVTLAELCERIQEAKGMRVSESMMCRELQILDLPLKKSRFTTASARRRA
jgi:transposase